MLIILYMIIAVFATSAILEAWFHEGGIFENIRNNISLWLLKSVYPEVRAGYSPDPITNYTIIKEKVAQCLVQLIQCRKCLTYWISAGSFLLIFISQLSVYTHFILYAFVILAIARGAHLIDNYLDRET